MYAEIVKAGEKAGADLVVFETMTDLFGCQGCSACGKGKQFTSYYDNYDI